MLMSTAESFADDGGRFFGPYKGGRVRIPLGEIPVDVANERAHRLERAPADRLAGQDAEPRFDHVQPRGPGGREVKVHPGMGRQLWQRLLRRPASESGRLCRGTGPKGAADAAGGKRLQFLAVMTLDLKRKHVRP